VVDVSRRGIMNESMTNAFTTIDFGSERSGPNPGAAESDEIDVKGVIRRLSSKSSLCEFDDLNESDLRRDYQTAIDCLIQCESMIKDLQDQLLAKDERIESLEDKIMHMSLQLASSMSREDHLQHKMRTSFTSASSNDQATNISRTTTSTTIETGFSYNSNASRTNEKTASADESCRISKLGLFRRNSSCTRRPSGMQLEFPKSQDVEAVEEGDEEGHLNNTNFLGPQHRPARKKFERQPSSRSFLELTGVIFPSTSLDVLAKGCLMKGTKRGGMVNEGWEEFR
jgi:hypothetical protein